jgi:hypothetical protein
VKNVGFGYDGRAEKIALLATVTVKDEQFFHLAATNISFVRETDEKLLPVRSSVSLSE